MNWPASFVAISAFETLFSWRYRDILRMKIAAAHRQPDSTPTSPSRCISTS